MPSAAETAATLVDKLLPHGLDVFLRERRAAGDSYATIARHLDQQYGVRFTGETIRRWYADLEAKDHHPAGGAA